METTKQKRATYQAAANEATEMSTGIDKRNKRHWHRQRDVDQDLNQCKATLDGVRVVPLTQNLDEMRAHQAAQRRRSADAQLWLFDQTRQQASGNRSQHVYEYRPHDTDSSLNIEPESQLSPRV